MVLKARPVDESTAPVYAPHTVDEVKIIDVQSVNRNLNLHRMS